MPLIRCTDCGRHVSARLAACPYCGGPVPDRAGERPVVLAPVHRRRRGRSVLLFAVTVLVSFPVIVELIRAIQLERAYPVPVLPGRPTSRPGR